MAGKVNAIPKGYEGAMPYLIVKDATRALEFYQKAFGATEINWTPMSRQNSPEFKLRPLLQLQRNSAAPCVQGKHPSRRQNGLG